MQISCRDKNRLAIQGDILGGAAMGVTNMLCLSGDGVQLGDHPQANRFLIWIACPSYKQGVE
jgi:methylenetetrahydrofolate reductase (NADPH)